MTGESWVDRYRPRTFSEIQGNTKALGEIKEWADNWSPGDDAILLVGPPGTGKTTTAKVVANYLDVPLNDTNASDERKSDEIAELARSMRSTPASSEYQLVFIDEVDSWHHATNKKPLYDELQDPQNPTILAANDKYKVPDGIKRKVNTYDFKLQKRSRKARLKDIIDAEDLDVTNRELDKLADRQDLRSAINDLQSWSESGIPPGDDQRQMEVSPFTAIEGLLKGGDAWDEALDAGTEKGLNPESGVLWADQNLAKEYRGLEAGLAYEALSLADKWLGRAQRIDYRYWRYASKLLHLLPELRLTDPYQGYINVDFPDWFKSSSLKHDGDTPEARLFRKLKDDGRTFRFAGSFSYFYNVYLDVLRGLPEEEKYELALHHGLDDGEIEVLGLDPDDYDEWQGTEAEEGDGWSPDMNSAADW